MIEKSKTLIYSSIRLIWVYSLERRWSCIPGTVRVLYSTENPHVVISVLTRPPSTTGLSNYGTLFAKQLLHRVFPSSLRLNSYNQATISIPLFDTLRNRHAVHMGMSHYRL
jgi:hypothetical protein